MPYVDFDYVKAAVTGREKMLELFKGHPADEANIDDNSASHPWFQQCRAIAEKETNDALRAAGKAVPNASPDEWFMRGVTYILVGKVNEAASNREGWQKRFKEMGEEFLQQIAAGVTVPGAVDSPDTGDSGVSGSMVDRSVFDPPSKLRRLFPDLGGQNFFGDRWR